MTKSHIHKSLYDKDHRRINLSLNNLCEEKVIYYRFTNKMPPSQIFAIEINFTF